MKKLLRFLLVTLIVLVVFLLLHPLWIGPLVTTAVPLLAPKFLGVPAKIDSFSVNLYSGRVTLDGLVVDNPPVFGTEKLVTIGHFCVDVEPLSVLTDTIVVEEVSLADLYLSILTAENGTRCNLNEIAKSSSAEPQEAAPQEQPEEPVASAKEEKPAKKVIIDRLSVRGVLVQMNAISLPLPSFEMTGIGRNTGGVEFKKAWLEIETKALDAMGPLAQGLKNVVATGNSSLSEGLTALQNTTQSLNTTMQSLGEAAKNIDTKKVTETLDSGIKTLDSGIKALDSGVKSFQSIFK